MAADATTKNVGENHQVEFTTELDVSSNYIHCQIFCENKNVDYAFYLVVDGVTAVKQWYKSEPECFFRLEYDRTKEHSIVFFVRDLQGNIVKKTEKINQHYKFAMKTHEKPDRQTDSRLDVRSHELSDLLLTVSIPKFPTRHTS